MKLIAIDMDGTLVNKQLKVTKDNKEAIIKAKENGHVVVIATGRSFDEARHALKDAELYLPLICVNGAEIRSDSWEIISSIPIPQSQFKEVEKVLTEESIYFELYTSEGTFTDNRERAYQVMKDIVLTSNPEATDDDVQKAALRRFKLGIVQYVNHYSELLQREGLEIYKFLAFDHDKNKLGEVYTRLQEIHELAVSASAKSNLEITNAEAQKGIALERFAKQQGISLSNAMAIGDNLNDLSMLSRVGIPVAMGNGEAQVKKAASFVTKTNDESGVAYAIEHFLGE